MFILPIQTPTLPERPWTVQFAREAKVTVRLASRWEPDHAPKSGALADGEFHAGKGDRLTVGYAAKVSPETLRGILDPELNRRGGDMKARSFEMDGWRGAAFAYGGADPSTVCVVMTKGTAVRMVQIDGHPTEDEAVRVCSGMVAVVAAPASRKPASSRM